MAQETTQIERLDLANASEAQYAALHRFTSRLRLESLPDDPLTPLEVAIRSWRSTPSFVTQHVWAVWRGDEVVARGQVFYPNTEENRHVARFLIQVVPEARRQGIGRRLLAEVAPAARAAERVLLITDSSGRVPAGGYFLERLGAARGLEVTTSQLAIAAIAPGLIRAWQERGERSAACPEFELGIWDGPYPEKDLDAAVALHQVMNTQPRGSIDVEDHTFTGAQLRAIEAATFARGGKRWTLYAREPATGKLAGFTDVVWIPWNPEVLQQVNTGVFPEYRNRGLARRLKAAMLERVMRERPEVKFVRTGNATSNAAMLKINDELGFKPYSSQIVWQTKLEGIEAYLAGG